MTDKDGPGQADKRKAEEKTAEVAAENAENTVAQRVGTDQTPERADDAPKRVEGVEAAVDPFPDYGDKDVDELQSLADARGVEINRDVEKAELIKQLRKNDGEAVKRGESEKQVEGAENPYASYDVMPLEELRKLADSRDVGLDEEFRKAHLITELRAADTSGGVSVALKNDK